MEKAACIDRRFVVANVSKALAEQVRVEGTISPCLFELGRGGIHGLSSGSEDTGSQHFDLLCMADFSSSVDHFLSCLKKFPGEVTKLQYLSFDKRIS